MFPIVSPLKTLGLSVDADVRYLIERAEQGDASVLPELRSVLDGATELWERYGDVAAHTHASLIQSLCGDNLFLRECLERKLQAIKAQIHGGNAIDRFMVDKIITCWLQSAQADQAFTRAGGMASGHVEELIRLLDASHRNQAEALRTLATVRKLLRPPLTILVARKGYRFLGRAVRYARRKVLGGIAAIRAGLDWSLKMAVFAWHLATLRLVLGWRIRATVPAGASRRIAMLVVSQLHVDPRVEREARALAAGGYHVTVICPAWYATEEERPDIDWGPNVDIQILPQAAGAYVNEFPYVMGPALYRAALAVEADAYHSHDLNTALPALRASAARRAACVCDFHEWFSENVTWESRKRRYLPHPFLKRWAFQLLEKTAVRCSTEVITVCQSIGEHLEAKYGAPKPVHIIRNIPPLRRATDVEPADLRQMLGIAADQRIVIYQGGVGPSRNLEPVITAFARVPNAVLVIRGPGNDYYGDGYLRLARRVGAHGKVFCLPPVASARVVAEARAADCGLWTLLANVGLNFKFSLPNKVFEYLAAGLPLIGADLPEVRRLVNKYQIGVCYDPDNPVSCAEAINRMCGDEEFRQRCAANIPAALEDLKADKEWEKLVRLYDGIWGK